MGELLFLGLITVIVCSAFWVVISPNLVHSAVSLLITLFGIAGLYVFLYADFLAATQIVIYVGGILVLIIFGVMLTNKIDKPVIAANSSNKIIGLFISGFIFSMLSIIVLQTPWNISSDISEGPSTVELIGHLILGKYLLPFELVSVLLLAALTGSAMLARKKIDEPLSVSDDLEKNIEKEENLDNDSEKEKLDDKEQEENTNG
jgi:NADH:ubiquinone oxidoreductase subunit 6 (subunit J)|tara:strand:- start:69 stop:680 length:612 start_codon:yes stop_codon:yes gene_type:complete